ncbi:MAG: (2Fe-2S)-binding protein [Pirellulales bacterium]|nr:(2Fe-2S)-binding protein [Pirellulales bacterium]
MRLDDELCLCFHVTKRKVLHYLRVERPRVPSQLSECHGAGTGCGWCRTMLQKMWEDFQVNPPPLNLDEWEAATHQITAAAGEASSTLFAEPDAATHALLRAQYIQDGKGKPPG